jgi:hypothetical protein
MYGSNINSVTFVEGREVGTAICGHRTFTSKHLGDADCHLLTTSLHIAGSSYRGNTRD